MKKNYTKKIRLNRANTQIFYSWIESLCEATPESRELWRKNTNAIIHHALMIEIYERLYPQMLYSKPEYSITLTAAQLAALHILLQQPTTETDLHVKHTMQSIFNIIDHELIQLT